jgi:prepilin-type N-terminal cleavage/methylation domain-containing protein
MYTEKKTNQKGFTLVETLVAISILVLAVTGAFSAAHNGMMSSLYSKDQITAFYLAQEAIEQIRNMRDSNGLVPTGWMNGIANVGDPCELNTTCYVDALSSSAPLVRCSGVCPNLLMNTNGFYSYDSGSATKFRRQVTITAINANEIVVAVSVYWSKGILVDKVFTAREHLFNWQ